MTGRTRVDVVGGGIAGLTLAAALDPERFAVTVHEAQPERSQTGSALGVWAGARRALAGLGAWADLAPQAARQHGGALHTVSGRRLVGGQAPPLWMVERPAILQALRAAVPPSVQHRHEVVTDPATLPGDLVVGADGVRSRVRELVTPEPDRVPTDYVALRGIRDDVDPSISYGEYWGRGRLFGIVPLGAGRAYWFTTHRSEPAPEPLDPRTVVAQARDLFAGAAPVVLDTLAQAGEQTLATRLWLAPALRRYARGRFVLVGDAAHASLPNLGRGANDAILDAVSLAAALQAGRSVRSWEAGRVPITQAARLTASGLMRIALGGGPGGWLSR